MTNMQNPNTIATVKIIPHSDLSKTDIMHTLYSLKTSISLLIYQKHIHLVFLIGSLQFTVGLFAGEEVTVSAADSVVPTPDCVTGHDPMTDM